MRWFAGFGMVLLSFVASAGAADWSRVQCPSNERLAQELIEMQVSGWGVAGAKDSCLAQARFRYVSVSEPPSDAGGEAAEKPKMVDEVKPFTLTSVRDAEMGRLRADFTYNIVDGTKTTQIKDALIFRRYEGFNKVDSGCGAVVTPPKTVAVKKNCYPR